MRSATLLVRGESRDLLRNGGELVTLDFELPTGLRDLVQSAGVPHVEVGAVRVDGAVVGWETIVDDGAVIEIDSRYPLESPPADLRFVADVHLARLARHLRLCGFDTVWDEHRDDPELAAISLAERRTLLTRDRGLLMRSGLRDGTYVRATDPRSQLVEVLGRFALRESISPFTRCLACNGLIHDLERSTAIERVPASVAAGHDRFSGCSDCGRVYWAGSHHERMTRLVAAIEQELADHAMGDPAAWPGPR